MRRGSVKRTVNPKLVSTGGGDEVGAVCQLHASGLRNEDEDAVPAGCDAAAAGAAPGATAGLSLGRLAAAVCWSCCQVSVDCSVSSRRRGCARSRSGDAPPSPRASARWVRRAASPASGDGACTHIWAIFSHRWSHTGQACVGACMRLDVQKRGLSHLTAYRTQQP